MSAWLAGAVGIGGSLVACSAGSDGTQDSGTLPDAKTDGPGSGDGASDAAKDTGLQDGNSMDSGGDSSGDALADASDSGSNACLQNGAKNGVLLNVSDGTGHALVVPKADIMAGVQKTYSIQGASTHVHNVTLTAADFQKLQQGTMTTVTSTTDLQHSHQVPVICA